jgi:DNA-binding SARP family transcriptional activator
MLANPGRRIIGETLQRVYLTGGLRIDGPSGSLIESDLPGAQGRLTFAVLAAERRPIARDELAELVWDGQLPPQWNAALTAIISKIRGLVTTTGLDGRGVVVSAGGSCAFHWPGDTWIDLEDARQRLDRAAGSARHGDHPAVIRDTTVASAVFRRPLLAGVSAGWVDEQRRRHDEALYECLTLLATAWSTVGNHRLAATIAERAIGHDPLREVGYRLLITAELGCGDHGAAQRAFRRCERTLRDELGVVPSPDTVAMIANLRPHREQAGSD